MELSFLEPAKWREGRTPRLWAGPSLPTLVPAVIPSAVDPPTGERAVARGATLVHGQPVAAQPGASGDGLLGLSRVDGRRDGRPRFVIIPEPERPRRRRGFR